MASAETEETRSGLKRLLSNRSSTSDIEPDAKRKPFICALKDLEADESKIPGEDASISECTKFLFNQFKILSHNFKELAECTEFATGQANDAIEMNTQTTKILTQLSDSVAKLSNENANLKQENIELKEHLLKLECQQRRENLVFEGIPEVKGETDENCYWKIVRHNGKYSRHQGSICGPNLTMSPCGEVPKRPDTSSCCSF